MTVCGVTVGRGKGCGPFEDTVWCLCCERHRLQVVLGALEDTVVLLQGETQLLWTLKDTVVSLQRETGWCHCSVGPLLGTLENIVRERRGTSCGRLHMMWRWLGFPLLVLLLGWCLGPLCTMLLLALPCLAWFLLGGRGPTEPPLDIRGRAVFITGCDSGFGKQLASRLRRMGCSVFAGCLFPQGPGAQELLQEASEAGSPGQLQIIPLNVCSDTDIACAKELLQSQLSETGLWALVNNAGISSWGNADWFSIEKYKQSVDVNLLGSIRTTLAFLPLLRKHKGRMVFLSSTNAFVTAKNGIYSMTKAALEKFCDSLRIDMKMFGIQVCIIEPGNFTQATNIQLTRPGEEIWSELSEELKEIYSKEYVQGLANVVNSKLKEGSSNSYEVIDAIVDALTSATPRARYMVASIKEKIMVYVFLIFPTALLDAMVSLKMK